MTLPMILPLTLAVTDEGLVLASGSQNLARIPKARDAAYDFRALGEAVRRAKERFPSQDAIILLVEDGVIYDDVIHAMSCNHGDYEPKSVEAMLVTAAGTLSPARVLVLGAGVAGLQAIATARRLGAIVSAFDVRAAVKEQVESLGAKFLVMEEQVQAEGAGGYAKELSADQHQRELEFLARSVKDADVVITTAAIPGRR